MNAITVGSAAFFGGLEGFAPDKTDKVAVVPQVSNGWWKHISTKDGVRLFLWEKHTISEMVEKLVPLTDCKRVSTLLVPDFVTEMFPGTGDVVGYLRAIKPAIATLRGKHEWGKVIYRAYVENGALALTAEQRAEAYAAYLADRKVNPSRNNARKI